MNATPLPPQPAAAVREWLWRDGEISPLEGATVPIEDRALQFADGIYEVVAAYDGVPVLLDEHLDRFERSAAGLRIVPAVSREERAAAIRALVGRFHGARAMVYGQLTRGAARRSHAFPAAAHPAEWWFVRALPDYPASHFEQGVPVVLHSDDRWKHCWIKSTSLLPNCLAKQFAAERGAYEAVYRNDAGEITEGSSTNIWCVIGGTLRTHPLNGRILGGIVRGQAIEIARRHGIPVREEAFSADDFRNADEAFLTSTTANVMPIASVDGQPVGTGHRPLTRALMALVADDLKARIAQG